MTIRAVLFDFDGTVANTNGLIIDSWQYAYRTILGHEAPEEEIKASFGEPLAVTMAKVFPNTPVQEAIDLYRDHQKDIYEELIEPFAGMPELIRRLRAQGVKVSITTSRMRNSTVVGLQKFGLMDDIDALITCEDTDKHKPDPAPVLISLERLGVSAEEALMVGDSMFDIKCAHNAGVKAALVGWAEAVTEEDLNGPEGPDYRIEKAEDLLALL